MKQVNKLSVQCGDQKVGELMMTPDNRLCAFQYDKSWLLSGFSISPIELPLKSDLFIAKPEPFWGNFGIFEDSLPDGYGRYLLNRLLKNQGIDDSTLTPLQRLSIVGTSGMGALSYIPESLVGKEKALPELDYLQQLALDILSEKTDDGADVLYFNSGNSGGCRPKCLYRDEEGAWLVKFRHTYDPKNMGEMEFRYNEIARMCGIEVSDFKLLQGKYFASKRFDLENDKRLHVATAGALVNEAIHNPKLDYKILLHLTGFLTQNPEQVDNNAFWDKVAPTDSLIYPVLVVGDSKLLPDGMSYLMQKWYEGRCKSDKVNLGTLRPLIVLSISTLLLYADEFAKNGFEYYFEKYYKSIDDAKKQQHDP